MATLSAEEYAILSQLMYDGSLFEDGTAGRSLKSILTEYKGSSAYRGIDDASKHIIDVAMNDPSLANMVLVDIDSYKQRGSRAVCWQDPRDESLVAVFQGTGRGEKIDGQATNSEWYTDAQGLTQADTEPQVAAANYVNYLSEKFKKPIAVTGHSNGANKAMYCAITCPCVTSAVVFDGQGFSQAFFDKYAAEIEANSSKITFYGQEGDYVGPLLKPLPIEKHYIKHGEYNTDGGAFKVLGNNHDIKSMFTLDADGNLHLIEGEPSELTRAIEDFMQYLNSSCPPDILEKIAPLMGMILDSALGTHGRSLEDLWNDPELADEWQALIGVLLLYDKLDDLAAALCTALKNTGQVGALDFLGISLDANKLIDLLHAYAHGPSAAIIDGYQKFCRAYARLWNARLTGGASGNMSAVRDFTEAKKQELLSIVKEVESENWLDPTRWDIWYRAERWFGMLTIQNYQNDMNTYYRKTIDIDGVTAAQIESIFSKVEDLSAKLHSADLPSAFTNNLKSVSTVMKALAR